MNFGIPINEYEAIRFSVGYKGLELISNAFSPKEVTEFQDIHGDEFGDIILTASWRHDSRNKILFPDSGGLQSIAMEATIPGSGLEYYKLDYQQQRFLPLTRNLALGMKGRLAYGDGYGDYENLPFFENFFAGGIRSIRGFDDNTLGPRDSNNNAIGGSFLTVFNLEVLFPVPFLDVSSGTRLSAFLDAGNVYQDINSFDVGEFRYSVGLAGLWSSPLGPISVSLGFPLNSKAEDQEQKFQFTVGTFF
jgi:outer membrane protein insertion porin family